MKNSHYTLAQIARRMGWSRQRLNYHIQRTPNVRPEVALMIEQASDGQLKARNLCGSLRILVRKAAAAI